MSRAQQDNQLAAGGASVWIFEHYATTPDMSGNTRQFDHALRLAQNAKWRVNIFATPFNGKTRSFSRPVSWRQPVRTIQEGEVEFTWLYSLPYRENGWRRYLNMVSYLVMALCATFRREPPDVVIGSSPHLLAGLTAMLVARRHRVPFVFEVRDLWPDTLIDMGLRNPLIIRPLAALERSLYRHATIIVPVSQGIHDGIVAKGVPASRLVTIPNAPEAVDPISMADRACERARHGWTDRMVCIYAGAHGVANGLQNLIEAARQLPPDLPVLIVLLGDGPEKDRLVSEADGLANVSFMDPVPKAEIHRILSAADAGIISLRSAPVFEGVLPNKLFDYISAGLPMITTVPGESRAIVEETGMGIYVSPESPSELARAMIRLAVNPRFLRETAAAAAAYARTMPTRDNSARMLDSVLDQALALGRNGQVSATLPEIEGAERPFHAAERQ